MIDDSESKCNPLRSSPEATEVQLRSKLEVWKSTEVGAGMIENERKEKKWRNFSTPSPFLPWKPEANQSE